MPSDTLEIFGTEYTGVAGIKATDDNGNTMTYVRPQGNLAITENTNSMDVSQYATVSVAVPVAYVSQDANGALIFSEDGIASHITYEDVATRLFKDSSVTVNSTFMRPYTFFADTNLVSISAPNCVRITDTVNGLTTGVGSKAFAFCTNLTTVNFPKLTDFGSGGYQFQGCTSLVTVHIHCFIGQYMFYQCTGLRTLVSSTANAVTMNGSGFSGCSNLEIVDLKITRIQGSDFINCAKLGTLILRNTSVPPLANINAFSNTPFASGKSGGTIYIPKVLYDALGTGTNDYKATANWSTIDGYGTITWAKIEGSQYENYYADGTAVST